MPASRACWLAYCGCSTPVAAQVSRLTRLSALRAMWASTWPRDHPGSRDGARTSSSDRVLAVSSSRDGGRLDLGGIGRGVPVLIRVRTQWLSTRNVPNRPVNRAPDLCAGTFCPWPAPTMDRARGASGERVSSNQFETSRSRGVGSARHGRSSGDPRRARAQPEGRLARPAARLALIVFTGLSGSGKSSLAFDTIFAEGQRRYVESLSAYARQFLGQMDKPDVDFIEGLSPAVSIDQKSTSRNPRSTVGTITEVYDYLRLLYARIGHPHCPVCGRPISRQTPQQIVDRILELDEGMRFQVLAPLIRGRKGEYADLFADLQTKGFARVRVDGVVYPLTEPPKLEEAGEAHDRGRRRPARGEGSAKRRLTDSVETALKLADGVLTLEFVDLPEDDPHRERVFSEHLACTYDDLSFEELEPRSFSFNSPFGACTECTGLGTKLEVDPDLIIADPTPLDRQGRHRTLGRRPWVRLLRPAARFPRRHDGLQHVDAVEQPAAEGAQGPCSTATTSRYTSATRTGTTASARTTPPTKASSRSSRRRHSEVESEYSREKFEGYMREVPCPECHGKRSEADLSRGYARRQIHCGRRVLAHRRMRDVPSWSRTVAAREADRRAVAQGSQRPLGIPARRRPALPVARPCRWHAGRRRSAAHQAGDADRVGAGRCLVRARRTEHRAASTRQPPADRHVDPAARSRQHAHRGRARRRHHPDRRLGRRHRPRCRRARWPSGGLGLARGSAGQQGFA